MDKDAQTRTYPKWDRDTRPDRSPYLSSDYTKRLSKSRRGRFYSERGDYPVKMGRPTVRSEQLAETICDKISEGESLVSICADPEMPAYITITRWLRDDDDFRSKYARAREEQARYKEHEMMQVVQLATNENIQVARLHYDAIKWQMSKLAPKVYGERANTEVNLTNTVNNITISETQKLAIQEARRLALNIPPDGNSPEHPKNS